jgi:hypothetical protein
MLDDLGASVRHTSIELGVSQSTVYRWINGQQPMPRAAQLAVFWLTKWGRSAVNAAAENDAVLYFGLASRLADEVAHLRAQLAKIGHLGDFGSANDPTPGVSLRRPTPAETVDHLNRFYSILRRTA